MIVATLLLSLLILQFDGSLRHPQDPGYVTDGIPHVACCAAIIRSDPNNNANNHTSATTLMLGGGMVLDPSTTKRSVEAEYEGVLMGLKQVCCMQNQGYPFQKLVIQGDCKTVVDQISGRARGRKLESFSKRAKVYLDTLRTKGIELHFEHIPRKENFRCDRMASSIHTEFERYITRTVEEKLYELFQSYQFRRLSSDDIESYLRGPLCRVVHSKRHIYYQTLGWFAFRLKNYELLAAIGMMLEQLPQKSTEKSSAKKKC